MRLAARCGRAGEEGELGQQLAGLVFCVAVVG
jgi:hypothetical protein